MKPELEVRNEVTRRVVYVPMSGLHDETTMPRVGEGVPREEHDRIREQAPHGDADMRGMKTARPAVAAIMGEGIGYSRRHGVVLCAHISETPSKAWEAARLARQNSPSDDVTIDVDSIAEAERVVRS